jgi:hypothetical protein
LEEWRKKYFVVNGGLGKDNNAEEKENEKSMMNSAEVVDGCPQQRIIERRVAWCKIEDE